MPKPGYQWSVVAKIWCGFNNAARTTIALLLVAKRDSREFHSWEIQLKTRYQRLLTQQHRLSRLARWLPNEIRGGSTRGGHLAQSQAIVDLPRLTMTHSRKFIFADIIFRYERYDCGPKYRGGVIAQHRISAIQSFARLPTKVLGVSLNKYKLLTPNV